MKFFTGQLQRAEVEQYWWYRLIKVLYILFVLLIAVVIAIEFQLPKVDMGLSTYAVKCNDNSLTYGKYPSTDISYDYSKPYDQQTFSFMDDQQTSDIVAKVFCQQGYRDSTQDSITLLGDIAGKEEVYYDNLFTKPNYTLYISSKVYAPTWSDVYRSIAYILVAALLLIIVVPLTFSYVLFGRKRRNTDVSQVE